MTKKQLIALENKCYDAENALNSALSKLSNAASEVLGFEVSADLCAGNEIEFRRVDEFGLSDSNSFIYMRDIISKL